MIGIYYIQLYTYTNIILSLFRHAKQFSLKTLILPSMSRADHLYFQMMKKTMDLLINTFTEIQTMNIDYKRQLEEYQKVRKEERNKKMEIQKKIQAQRQKIQRENRQKEKQSSLLAQSKVAENKKQGLEQDQKQRKPPTSKLKKSAKKPQRNRKKSKQDSSESSKDEQSDDVKLQNSDQKKEKRQDKKNQTEDQLFMKKKIHPQKPKFPLSSFFRFNRDVIGQVKLQYPEMTQTQLVTITGMMWKKMQPQAKQKYESQYKKQKKQYDRNIQKFYKKYPSEQTIKFRRGMKIQI